MHLGFSNSALHLLAAFAGTSDEQGPVSTCILGLQDTPKSRTVPGQEREHALSCPYRPKRCPHVTRPLTGHACNISQLYRSLCEDGFDFNAIELRGSPLHCERIWKWKPGSTVELEISGFSSAEAKRGCFLLLYIQAQQPHAGAEDAGYRPEGLVDHGQLASFLHNFTSCHHVAM